MTPTPALLLQNVNAFLSNEPLVRAGSEAIRPRTYAFVLEPPSRPNTYVVVITRTFVPRWRGRLALAALKRAGITPDFRRPADISYSISNNGFADYIVERWLRKTDFSDEVAQLDAWEADCDATNQVEADRLAVHPLSVRAGEQEQRQAAIEASSPTEAVDAWIIANMGYTAETLAALAKSTRRDKRREARQRMGSGS